jgi:hypothetical protein
MLIMALVQELRKLVQRCWSKDPEQRPEFEEVVQILSAVMKKVPRESPSAGPSHGGCCSVS